MKRKEFCIVVEKETLGKYERALGIKVGGDRKATELPDISFEADFGDGIKAKISVFNSDLGIYVDARLYENDGVVGYLDMRQKLAGEYCFVYKGKEYIVTIEPKKLKTFKIPCTFEMYGTLEIEAESLEEAIKIAWDDNTPLPDEKHYVDGSFKVEEELIGLV
jgi:hypothetical protein